MMYCKENLLNEIKAKKQAAPANIIEGLHKVAKEKNSPAKNQSRLLPFVLQRERK